MKNGFPKFYLLASFASLGMLACSESEVADLNGMQAQKDASMTVPAMDAAVSAPTDAGVSPSPDASVVVAGEVELNTDNVNFGDVVVTSTESFILTVRNPGMNPVQVSLSAPAGRDADRFTRSIGISNENGVFQLAPGQIVEVALTVSPNELGELFASLALDSCMGTCPVAITLEANSVATGVNCPTSFDVGTINPGECLTNSVVCENRGNITEVITAVDLNPTSDSEFALTPPALPIQFAANSTVGFEIEYCPTTLGQNSGELIVLTFEPTEIEHPISLTARGGGPDIVCTPAAVDFGVGSINNRLSREVSCENRGDETLIMSASVVNVGSPFVVVGQGSTGTVAIAAGDSGSLTIEVESPSTGVLTDTLQITSNDIDTPTIDISLTAEYIDVQNCTAVIVPNSYDFGLVSVGRAQRVTMTLENPGTSICVIQNVGFGMSSASEFVLDGAPTSGDSLAAGASVSFDVIFTPTTAATSAAILAIEFANPMTPTLTANLSGSGGDINLVASPAQVGFGPTPVGCAAPQQASVELTNVGTQNLTILSANIVGSSSTAFSVTGFPAMGTAELDRLETLTLEVLFDPQSIGPQTDQLRIVVDGQASPTLVSLSGVGAQQPTRTDVFDFTSPQADVLFVVDDSCSMQQSQDALAANFEAFSDTLVDRGVDLHFAVVTTDMNDQARQGRMIGTPPYVTNMTMDFVTEMEARVQPGIQGSGREMGILAGLRAVTPPLTVNENMGFLRNDADLVMVILSDEDDQSPGQFLGGGIEDAVVTLQGAAGNGRLSVSGIVGPPTTTCNGPYGIGQDSSRYGELITRVGDGLSLSYCNDMGQNLQELANDLFGGPSFDLAREPLPATIAVTVDGVSVPAQNMGQAVWTYNPVTQAVVFAEGSVPNNGAQIRISYSPYCLSPTCGDATTDMNEACDDGNMSNEDACTDGCRGAYCGDGFTYMGQEDCDDANQDNTDACVTGCVAATCGDGFVQAGVEDCDDGNTVDGDGCPGRCIFPGYTVSTNNNAPYVELDPMTATDIDPQSPNQMGQSQTNIDDGVATIQLPFAFNYYGVPTSSVTVSVNGLVIMGAFNFQNTAGNQSIPDTDAPNGIIAAWWDDLHYIENQMAYPSGLSYEVFGTAPNRKVVVQWKNMRHYNQDGANDGFRRWNFQITMEETTNLITLNYGETEFIARQNNFAPYSASVGFEDGSGTEGEELLTCTPNCDQGDFEEDESITLTPR